MVRCVGVDVGVFVVVVGGGGVVVVVVVRSFNNFVLVSLYHSRLTV